MSVDNRSLGLISLLFLTAVTGPKGTAYADNLPCEGRECLRTKKCNPTKVHGCR